MVDARRLRGGLRATNVVLALALAGLVGYRLTVGAAPRSPESWPEVAPVPPSGPSQPEPSIDLDAFLEDLDAFHGPSRRDEEGAPGPAVAATTDRGPVPLTLYRIATAIQAPGRPALVQIVSKDPARAESHTLVEGREVDGILLERFARSPAATVAFVTRGTERAQLVLQGADPQLDRILRLVPQAPAAPSVAGVRGASPGRGDGPGLRTVPFRDERGVVIGLRVTGIDPEGPWARSGLRAGEAIVGIDGVAVTDAGTLVRDGRAGRLARELLVRDALDAHATPRTVRLP